MPGLLKGTMVLGFLSLPKWLRDPFGYIRDKLDDLYNGLGAYIQNWIIKPPHPAPGAWLDYLYGNSLGLALYLIGAVGFVTILMMVLSPRHSAKLWRAAIVTVLIAAIYPYWFSAGNWFSDAGSSLISTFAAHPGQHGSQLLILPEIHNVLGAIFGTFILLFLGGVLLAIFFLYQMLLVIAIVLGLPLLALAPLSEGFKRKFEQIIVLVIVTSFFGRLVAVFILSLGSQFQTNVAFAHNAFGAVMTLLITLVLAIVSQWYLLKQADKIYGDVTGRTLGTSRVTGMVETIKRSPSRESDMSGIQAAHVAALAPPIVPSPPSFRLGSSVSSSVTHDPTAAARSRKPDAAKWAALRRRRNS
jgi:hypothetical protein